MQAQALQWGLGCHTMHPKLELGSLVEGPALVKQQAPQIEGFLKPLKRQPHVLRDLRNGGGISWHGVGLAVEGEYKVLEGCSRV